MKTLKRLLFCCNILIFVPNTYAMEQEPTEITQVLPAYFFQKQAPQQGDKCRCGWFATYLGLIMHEYAKRNPDLSELNLEEGNLSQWIKRQQSVFPRIQTFQKTLQKYCDINPENNTKIHSKDIKNLICMHFNNRNIRIPENISIIEKGCPEGSSVACIRNNISNFKRQNQPQLVILYCSRIGHWVAFTITTAGVWIADSYYQPIRLNSSLFRNIEKTYRIFCEGKLNAVSKFVKELE